MKPLSALTATLLISAGLASAATFSASWNSGFASGTTVPDGSATGWSDVRSLPIPADHTITDVNVTMSLTGGWNGDLYAYLSHPNGTSAAVLLNRPGRSAGSPLGYGDNVLTITLDDGAANGDTHTYQSAVSYLTAISNNSPWQPDGRTVNPFTVNGTEPRTAMLSVFNGMAPSNTGWTLFISDLASGDAATVSSWGLTITTVPEQGTALTTVFAGTLLFMRRRR
jgi:subtilisin-like proprotein convertase family protein